MTIFNTYFTEREEKQLLSHIRKFSCPFARRDLNWMLLMRHTALRVGVLHGLTIGDAEKALEAEYLHVRPEVNKNDKVQDIYLNKSAKASIRQLLQVHKLICDNAGGVDWDLPRLDRPLILSRKLKQANKSMAIRSFQDRMKFWDRESGLELGCTPHWWRHTWARRALENSTNPAQSLRRIQEILGHADIRTTQVYTMPNKEDLKQIMRDAQ